MPNYWSKQFFDYRDQGRLQLHAYVIMPDHFHAIITPAVYVLLEKAMQYIKGGFSFGLKSKLDVWERGFNESQIMTGEKFKSCVRYIHENPIRRGIASAPNAYLYTSANRAGLDPMPAHMIEENRA